MIKHLSHLLTKEMEDNSEMNHHEYQTGVTVGPLKVNVPRYDILHLVLFLWPFQLM